MAQILLAPGVEADEEALDADGHTALNLSMGGDMCRLLHKVHMGDRLYCYSSLYVACNLLSCLLVILNFVCLSLLLSFCFCWLADFAIV